MAINLSDYGWSGLDAYSVLNGELTFLEQGTIINNSTYMKSNQMPAINANFIYKSVDNGLILWYNTIGYVIYKVTSNLLLITRVYEGNEIVLKSTSFTDKDIIPPIDDETFNLRSEINGTNIKCYYNDTLVLNIEQNTFSEGVFGIYGDTGTVCTHFELESTSLENWQRYWNSDSTGHIVVDNDIVTVTKAIGSDLAGLTTNIVTIPGETYTLSMKYKGNLLVKILQDDTVIQEVYTESEKETAFSYAFNPTGESTKIRILSNGEVLTLREVQIEQKAFSTSYIKTDRETGIFSLPASKVNQHLGGLSLWISPIHSYASGILPIFYYNDELNLIYENGTFVFTYGANTLSAERTIEAGQYYNIICTWKNDTLFELNIYEQDEIDVYAYDVLTGDHLTRSDTIHIGCTPEQSGNLVVDSIVVYAGETTLEDMKKFRILMDDYEDNRVVINIGFENDAIVYAGNKIFIPNGKPLSPIIVQDMQGRTYERVYFVNYGGYSIYNKETFKNEGSKEFELDYDNILRARAYNDSKFFNDVTILGPKIIVNDLLDEDKTVTIEYTPRDVFCVNFDQETESLLLEISNVSGEAYSITYENEFGADTKLVRTIETNPFKSINNNGFIYVTQTPILATTLDVTATPDILLADGNGIATITVDCIGEGNVPTSNVDLEVSLANRNKYGRIERYISEEEQAWLEAFEAEKVINGESAAILKYGEFITDEHMSGRFIYKFYARDIAGSDVLTENISIMDKKSGIGTEVPIRIVSR